MDLNKDGQVDLCDLHALLGYPICQRCCPCSKICSCGCVCCECCCSIHCRNPIHYSPICIHHSPCRHSPRRSPSLLRYSSSNDIKPVSQNLSLRLSPKRRFSPSRDIDINRSYDFSQSQQIEQISPSLQLRNSPIRKYSNQIRPSSDLDNNFSSSVDIQRVSDNLSLRRSPERRFSPKRSYNRQSYQTSPLRSTNASNYDYDKNKFIDFLKKMMNYESELERMKINLSLKNDFNVEDAFRVFELNGRGYLTVEDLEFGLNSLEVYPSSKDLRLLMKRFDLNKNGFLNYADFFDILVPFEKDYRCMVENRPPNSCCNCRCPDVFSVSTKIMLKNIFNKIIDCENDLNDTLITYSNVISRLREFYYGVNVT